MRGRCCFYTTSMGGRRTGGRSLFSPQCSRCCSDCIVVFAASSTGGRTGFSPRRASRKTVPALTRFTSTFWSAPQNRADNEACVAGANGKNSLMVANAGIIQRAASPFAGVVNRARLGFPRRFFRGDGSLGGDLASTVVFRELKKRGTRGIAVATPHRGLFERNPDVDEIISRRTTGISWGELGLPLLPLGE